MSDILQIRARHIMCLAGFQKKWYDNESKQIFDDIIQKIKKRTDIQTTITDSCDIICYKCSNFINGKCMKYLKAEEDYIEKDNHIFTLIKLEPNTTYRLEYIAQKFYKHIRRKEQVDFACNKCKFKAECKFYNELK